MIRINVQVIVKDENRAQILAALENLSINSRMEEGCLAYDIYENTSTEEKLLILETWESEDFLKLHQQSSHYLTYSPQLRKFSLDVRVEKFVY